MTRRGLLLSSGLLFILAATHSGGPFSPISLEDDRLLAEFAAPPESARPWVYWMWMDGNLTREGITEDLEAMKAAGLGGVIICEVSVGIPRGPVEFMSSEWRRLFAHVVREAERLGLEITLNAGPGWTGSGGPWVKPEDSMQHLVASSLEVSGPLRLDTVLPRPERRPAFFGENSIPPSLKDDVNDFYLDAAVLVFPTPENGSMIEDIDEKALYVRAPYSSQVGVKPYLPAPADFPSVPAGAVIDPVRILDLTDRLGSDGRLTWDVPAGRWTILRFGRTSTGANTRPAPVPGWGLESDKMDKAALEAHYRDYVGALLREIGPRRMDGKAGWTMIHIDSWEMGAQNWTRAFREEFLRRRGYDPLPYLPVYTGRIVKSPEVSERFLWDLRQTAQELVVENHAEHLKALGRRDHFGLSIEPYDMTPCADMTLGTAADVPMGEFWLYGFHTAHSVAQATGIAHTTGKTIVAAEAFTSDSPEAWQAHPASLKALGDWALAAGINRIAFHRYQGQAGLEVKPGMTMGPYGVHWEHTQTWWDMVPAYHLYLSRAQYLLRQGLPVADVCFLVAEGAPHVFLPPRSALRGDPPDRTGYNFDGCAPETLLASASVRDGRIVFPDGMSYRVLVLPERETMTPALLRKVRDLVASGATVIGPKPRKSPSLSGYPQGDEDVRSLADELWGACDGETVTENRYRQGRIVWVKGEKDSAPVAAAASGTWFVGPPPLSEPPQYGDYSVVTEVLERLGVPPDFSSGIPLRYAHRRDKGTEIYFVSNPEAEVVETTAVFRVAGLSPELFDAVTGEVRELPRFAIQDGLTSVPLRFEPHQSFFVVFRRAADPADNSAPNFSPLQEAGSLNGPWEVFFDPKWGGPERIVFEGLSDWSKSSEPGLKYYSGTATYRKMFDLPAAVLSGGSGRIFLDLGAVNHIARVRLNGLDLGVVWTAPWRLEITSAVHSKGNVLEIAVANLWPNRLIGDEQEPPDAEYSSRGALVRWPEWILKGTARPSQGRLAFSTWKHYSKDSPLLPSGLLGPVRILTVKD